MIVLTENDMSPRILTVLHDIEESEEAVVLATAKKKFVIVSEEEYNGWQETNYLLSSETNRKALQEAMSEKPTDGIELNDAIRKLESRSN